jgi:hypothetical protein
LPGDQLYVIQLKKTATNSLDGASMKENNAVEQVRDVSDPTSLVRTDMNLGRDELNLAEFPLAVLANRVSAGQKTLVFEDTIWDKGHQRQVTRRLTITASDKYGLPTALDDEVIFALVQVTKAAEFASRTVPFSRYQLAQTLGWQDGGRSYGRLETSLKRWLGVTLYYENAWWDKRSRRWVDAHFHLLDNLVLFHRRSGPSGCRQEDRELCRSSFTWNEVVFRSFQAGYLKQIDVSLYRRLALATAKRMFRFLDKRFHFSRRLRFDLSHFAYEHIGLSRRYDVAQLRRRLDPAIRELEAEGVLEPMDTADRYQCLRRGAWEVAFVKRLPARRPSSSGGNGDTTDRLMQRGVTAAAATRLVREFPEHSILGKIQVFDALVGRHDKRVSRNPAGYLVQSIRDDYQVPDRREHNCPRESAVARRRVQRQVASSGPRWSRHDAVDQDRRRQVEQYLSRLSPGELAQVEERAMTSARQVLAEGYHRAKAAGNDRLLEHYRQAILQCHVEQILGSTGRQG